MRIFRPVFMAGALLLAAAGCVFAQDQGPSLVFVQESATPIATATRTATPTRTAVPSAAAQPAAATRTPAPTSTAEPASTPTPVAPAPTVTRTPLPSPTATPTPTPARVPTATPSPVPTPRHTSTPSPTPTRTPRPNNAPTLEALEFDGKAVLSQDGLFESVRTESEVDVRLRARDEDGNLSHIMLVDADGDELDREDCGDLRGSQCTALLSMEAPDDANETVQFIAVALDTAGAMSAEISFEIETERSFGGGGGGGGGGSSPPPPPPCIPTIGAIPGFSGPTLVIQSGQGCVGQVMSLDVVLSQAPEGLSGFDIDISLSNSSVAEIVSVEYFPNLADTEQDDQLTITPSDLALSPVNLFAADTGQFFQAGATDITLANIGVLAKSAGTTLIIININTGLGVDDDDGKDIVPLNTQDGALTVN